MPELTLFDLDLRPTAAPAQAVAAPHPAPARRPASRPRPTPRSSAPTVLVVDGNSLAHRAYHAYSTDGVSALTAADGRPLGALYGFLALLTGICEKVGPDAVVVGFDCRVGSRRRDRFPDYKAQRPEKDPLLLQQLADLECLLERLGVSVVVEPGEEADDVLGSGAAAAEAAGWRAVLATSDRDSYALVSAATTVLRLGSGLDAAVEVTPDRLRRQVGVDAAQYTEYAALRGDASDNLPGITGLGPKRAAALLREYPTVAAAAADPIGCRSVLGRPVGQALLDDLADADGSVFHRNCALMAIRRDLDVDVEAARPAADPASLERHLLAWELPTLVGRVQVALGTRPDLPPPPGDDDAPWSD